MSGVVFNKPGKEGGDVDFIAEHLFPALLPLFADAGGGEEFDAFEDGAFLVACAFGVVEDHAVFFLLFAGVTPAGAVEVDRRDAQHAGFGGHGGAFAIDQGGECDYVVQLFRRSGETVRFKIPREFSLGGDEDVAKPRKFPDRFAFAGFGDAMVAFVVGGVPGDETEEGENRGQGERDSRVGGEAVGMEVGEFVVAGVADLFFTEIGMKGFGNEDGPGKGFVEAHLLHVAGVFDADVWDAKQPACLGGIHGAVAEGQVRFILKQHAEHPEIEPDQPPDLAYRTFVGLPKGDEFQSICFQQVGGTLFFPAGEKNGMPLLLQLFCKVAENVDMGGVADVNQ